MVAGDTADVVGDLAELVAVAGGDRDMEALEAGSVEVEVDARRGGQCAWISRSLTAMRADSGDRQRSGFRR
jgi:hypothetical protein